MNCYITLKNKKKKNNIIYIYKYLILIFLVLIHTLFKEAILIYNDETFFIMK